MCGAGVSFIRAAPKSRWVRADFDDWQLGAVEGHARSLIDGFLLFNYLIEPAESEVDADADPTLMFEDDDTRMMKPRSPARILLAGLPSLCDTVTADERPPGISFLVGRCRCAVCSLRERCTC